MTCSRSDIEGREGFNDFHGFETDRNDPQKKLQWVAWVIHSLDCPVVSVVNDTAGLIRFNALALHYPVQRWLAVDDIFVGLPTECR